MNRILTLFLFWMISHFAVAILPVDEKATTSTKALLINLDAIIVGNGILIGHQNDLIGGKSNGGWKDNVWNKNPKIYNSDIWQVCGDYPAVHGFDIGGIEVFKFYQNSDYHHIGSMREAIIDAYHRNAIITVSSHMFNPISDTTSVTRHYGAWLRLNENDLEEVNPFPEVLEPGTALNDTLNAFLTIAGNYFNSLTTSDTVISLDSTWIPEIRTDTVPIIFRPYHEMNGGHFWWGNVACTAEQFKALWQYTYTFLTDTMDVHNLLYCYSPYGTTTESAYLERYPGDEYVDILGFEISGELDFFKETSFRQKVVTVQGISNVKGKPIALTETGIKEPTIFNAGANFFTEFFAELNKDYAKNIAYALFWRNLDGEWRVPFVGNDLEDDFLALYTNRSQVLVKFESDLSHMLLNKGLGPYVLHPDNFPTLKKEEVDNAISMVFVDGVLKINLVEAENCTLEIFNMKGQKLVSTSFVGNTFEKAFPAWLQVFIVRVSGETFQNTKKILVQ